PPTRFVRAAARALQRRIVHAFWMRWNGLCGRPAVSRFERLSMSSVVTTTEGNNSVGAFCALTAILCFSLVDLIIKLLSEQYALHQLVFLRSLVSLVFFLLLIMPFNGGWRVFRTQRPGMHLLRGTFIVCAN